ncbi:MAG: hypothetical protein KAU62_00580, partial [Candidatus Heimdallarchaeota archaeon]|nr:hypothetical protein [Candidatus Heimdallarchaeota archaeon]MCK4609627.1 hypothetical protein [Candidatus Heimdallarchaeota archaeon]
MPQLRGLINLYPIVHKTKEFHYDNPFADPNKESAERKSKELFYSLLPSHAYISVLKEQSKQSKKERNQWQVIYIVVLGEEGSGKSVTIDCLAKWFRDYYQGKKKRYTDLIWSSATARSLDSLFARIPEGKQFIFIGCEDATGLISNKDVDLFDIKRRRWICEHRTGLSEGVIVQVLGIHDWFAVHKLLRDASSLVLAKSSKTKLNVHDSGHQLRFMSPAGVKFTQEAAKYRRYIKNQKTKEKVKAALAKYSHYFGYGTYWLKETEKIGLWYNPDIDIATTKIYDLQFQRQGDEEIETKELYELPKYELTEPDYFHWEEAILEVILNSEKEKIKKYAKFFKAKYLDDLNYNRKETWDILKLAKTQIHLHYKEMENGQTSIGGFINKVRGELFEQHILA